MDMFYIILLIVLGLLFLVAELVLLPGVSIGAILSLTCYGASIYLAVRDYGVVGGVVVGAVIAILSLVATLVSLRAKTWQRFSLKQKIESSSMTTPQSDVKVGDLGTTLSRLSPMGKVEIEGRIYEAKSLDAYVDPRHEIEVVGFENFSVIVKPVKKQK